MKWKYKPANSKVRRKQMWHLWFAWYPVRVITFGKTHIIWLEKVLRRGSSWVSHGAFGWTWIYKENILKNNKK